MEPTPVLLPGESHGQRSLAGYSPWGCKESDVTERLSSPAGSSQPCNPRTLISKQDFRVYFSGPLRAQGGQDMGALSTGQPPTGALTGRQAEMLWSQPGSCGAGPPGGLAEAGLQR